MNTLTPFSHFNQQDGEGGSAVSDQFNQQSGVGGGGAGRCPLSADQYSVRAFGRFNQWGEGRVHMYKNFYYKGGGGRHSVLKMVGGGGGGTMTPLSPPPPPW